MTKKEENARTLASLLGITEDKAAELLDAPVLITCNHDCVDSLFLAERLKEILFRTVEIVTFQYSPGMNPAVEVVIGNVTTKTVAPVVYVGISDSTISISCTPIQSDQNANVHPIFLVLGACHASAMAVNSIIGHCIPYGSRNPIILDYRKMYGDDLKLLYATAHLGEAFLAGAGAVGNALLYSLRYFDIEGKINVVDPDIVSDGNLNRCLLFTKEDVNHSKANALVRNAQQFYRKLKLAPYPVTLREVPHCTERPWLRRLIIGVDSRRARRSLQSEIPGEVFDASTTDIREAVLHFHRQPTEKACLSCIYFQEEGEISHEQHVAEVLGVSVEEVKKGFVTESAARQMHAIYPHLSIADLIGKAYDSLFKQLCGQGKLKTAADKQVLAPFAFVSVLAGAYLAIEIVRRVQKENVEELFNYWRVSPWHSPNMGLQRIQLKKNCCEFCGDSLQIDIARRLWRR